MIAEIKQKSGVIRVAPKTCQIEGCKRETSHRCMNCYKWICEKHSHNGFYPSLCPECAKIPQSKHETETVITINKASPYAVIYTEERPWIKKLTKHKHAEMIREYKDDRGMTYAFEFIVDKNCISLTMKPRVRYDKL